MEPNVPHDAELVAQTLAGHREAFGLLYDRYARMVRTVVAGVSGDWSAVEDMIQESFLRGYRNLATLRDPGRFGRWIVGIARQVGRERRRVLRRDRHEFGNAPAPVIEQPTADHDDELELVMRRVAELPEKERLAIHAFFLEQQDAHRAAELLGYSRSGFYTLVQRAIARLAALLQPCGAKEKKG